MIRSTLCAAFLLATQCGCVSLTSIETGRTVGRGEFDLTLSVTSGDYSEASIGGPNDDDPEDHDARWDESYAGNYYPVVEVSGTGGIGERTDLGVRVNSALFVSTRIKQQLVGSKTSLLAASVGARAGINLGAALVGAVAYTHGSLPVYVSLHPADEIAFYAIPQYAVTTVSASVAPSGTGRSSPSTWDYFGLVGGVTYGTKHRIAVEAAHVSGHDRVLAQVSVGFTIRIDG